MATVPAVTEARDHRHGKRAKERAAGCRPVRARCVNAGADVSRPSASLPESAP